MPFTNPITQLVNNITGAINALLGKSPNGIPHVPQEADVAAILSGLNGQIIQENWMKLSFPYTFVVMDIKTGASANIFGDFALPLAPQAIKQSEEFAISLRPTQGGTTVSHSGNRYKTLQISGTTGIAPFRGDGGVVGSTGQAILQPKELKFLSGYEVFLRLRNWFKAYYEYKKIYGVTARDFRLVFKNYKDGEFLIVELQKFDMDRQAERSFLYDYNLEFKVLGHVKFVRPQNSLLQDIEATLGAVSGALSVARGAFLQTQGILRQVEATFDSVILEPIRKINLATKAFLGIGTTAADMGNKIISNTVSAAAAFSIVKAAQQQAMESGEPLPPDAQIPKDDALIKQQGAQAVINLGSALEDVDPGLFPESSQKALAQEQAEAQSLPRSFYERTLNDIIRVKQNAEDFFNLGDPRYDVIFGRTATLSASFAKSPTAEELMVLDAFNKTADAIRVLLSTESLFKSGYDEVIRDMIERFGGNLELFAETAVKQVRYQAGATLERIAQQELGDSNRWGEIAEVNGLKAPYVTDDLSDPRPYVLKPGDTFLIPVPATSGFSQAPQAKENKLTKNLSELERSLGTDFKLTPDFDLSLSNSGDLELVTGAQNMAQAVLLKLGYEKGEVMRYPELGAGIVPGTKFPPLDAVKDGIINTLLQDARVEGVEDLSIIREGSELSVRFNLKIKQVDIPVPVQLKV